jgi:hypothetical protein
MPSSNSVRRERRWFQALQLEPLEQLVLPGFLAPMHFDSGGGSDSVVVGDFNGDGIPDLAVVHHVLRGTVSVLLGNGDGSFQAPRTFDTGLSLPRSVAVGDFNGDGMLDLAFSDSPGDGGIRDTVSVLLGNGDGSFQAARVSFTDHTDPEFMAVGDFNGDGLCDIAVVGPNDEFSDVVSMLLLSNGDGTFHVTRSIGYIGAFEPHSVTVGDFNGDGIQDFAMGAYDGTGGEVIVFLGDPYYAWDSQLETSVGLYPPVSLAVGDFNGDGILDLVTNGSILLGNGDGTFQTAYDLGVFSFWAVGDFNGDGSLDLAGPASSDTVGVLLGNGDGSFQPLMTYDAGGFASSVAVGDFNGDVAPDLAVANFNDVSILLNDNAWAGPRPGGPPPGGGRAAAAAVEPSAAPGQALPPVPGVLPTDAGMAVLGSPETVTMSVSGPSGVPFRADADQDSAAAAPAPSGAASQLASVRGAFPGGPPALRLLDRLFAEPTLGVGGDLLAEQPCLSAL